MEKRIGAAILKLEKGDITKYAVDAVVNAANPSLLGGGGVDGAIHRAGGRSILYECRSIVAEIKRLDPGKAVITTGGNLPAKNVIHTVGPIWRGDSEAAARILSSAYLSSLTLADKMVLHTIAFPSISTGAYGYPLTEAARVALKTVKDYLKGETHLQEVIFVLFSDEVLRAYQAVLEEMSA